MYLGKSPLVNIYNTQADEDNFSVTSSVLKTNENLRLADINANQNFKGYTEFNTQKLTTNSNYKRNNNNSSLFDVPNKSYKYEESNINKYNLNEQQIKMANNILNNSQQFNK
jgi:hypothetical protein